MRIARIRSGRIEPAVLVRGCGRAGCACATLFARCMPDRAERRSSWSVPVGGDFTLESLSRNQQIEWAKIIPLAAHRDSLGGGQASWSIARSGKSPQRSGQIL